MVRSVRDASESSFALLFLGPREVGLPSVAVINTITKSNKEEEERAYFILQVIVHHQGNPGAGREDRSQSRYGGMLLAGLLIFLFYAAHAHLPRQGTSHLGLNPPPSNSSLENASEECQRLA